MSHTRPIFYYYPREGLSAPSPADPRARPSRLGVPFEVPTPPLRSWLCSQVAVPPVELKDQEPPAIVESGEHQQNEDHEETPSAVAPR